MTRHLNKKLPRGAFAFAPKTPLPNDIFLCFFLIQKYRHQRKTLFHDLSSFLYNNRSEFSLSVQNAYPQISLSVQNAYPQISLSVQNAYQSGAKLCSRTQPLKRNLDYFCLLRFFCVNTKRRKKKNIYIKLACLICMCVT